MSDSLNLTVLGLESDLQFTNDERARARRVVVQSLERTSELHDLPLIISMLGIAN